MDVHAGQRCYSLSGVVQVPCKLRHQQQHWISRCQDHSLLEVVLLLWSCHGTRNNCLLLSCQSALWSSSSNLRNRGDRHLGAYLPITMFITSLLHRWIRSLVPITNIFSVLFFEEDVSRSFHPHAQLCFAPSNSNIAWSFWRSLISLSK
jgi:hypothetical protein